MKFLECIKIEQWKNQMISTVSEKHKEITNLHKVVRRLRKASKKETKLSEKKRENKFRIITVVIVITLFILLCLAILYLSKKTYSLN